MHNGALHILLVEHDDAAARHLQALCVDVDPQWSIQRVGSLQAAREQLAHGMFQVIFLGLPIPDAKPRDAIVAMCTEALNVPTLVLVRHEDEALGLEAVQRGAQEYLIKDQCDQQTCARAVRYALERRHLLDELEAMVRQLQTTEANFQHMIECNADGLVVVDRTSQIAFANPAAATLLGRRLDQLLGTPWEYPLTTEKPIEICVTRAEGDDPRGIEMCVVETLWEGQRAWLASLRDITERKRIERMKDAFVSTVSHELRTPLTAIKGIVTLMLNRTLGTITNEQEDFLKTMSNDIDRLAELINSLLDLSKIQAGKMTLLRQRVDVAELIEQVCRSHQTILGHRRIVREFPSISPVLADPGRVVQVLANLLSNAVKFTADDGVITFRLQEQSPMIAVTIADNGPGIPKEDQGRLFQKFEQVQQSWTERPRGTGLGLAICREIIDLHHGQITVDSATGRGAAFTLTLPVFEPVSAFAQLFEDFCSSTAAESVGVSVLLVDVSDVHQHPSARVLESRAPIAQMCETTMRSHLSRHDCVLALEPSLFAILAIATMEGAQAIRTRMQKLCTDTIAHISDGATPINIAIVHVPEDGHDASAILQSAKARLSAARQTMMPHHSRRQEHPDG